MSLLLYPQKRTPSKSCEEHGGQEKQYYCENCCCTACSDCCILDRKHTGHNFVRVDEAAKHQTTSLKTLTNQVQDAEQMFSKAIQLTEHVRQQLEQNAHSKKLAINRAKDEVIQHVEDVVKIYKQDVDNAVDAKMKDIVEIQEELQYQQAVVKSASERALNILESGCASDIISVYPSLSAVLHQFSHCQPAAADNSLSYIDLKPVQSVDNMDKLSLDQLLCKKLNISSTTYEPAVSITTKPPRRQLAPNTTKHPSHQPFKPPNTTKLSSRQISTNVPNIWRQRSSPKATRTIKQSNISSSAAEISSVSSSNTRSPILRYKQKWKELNKLETTSQPAGIAIHPNGDIIVSHVKLFEPVSVLSWRGDLIYTLQGCPSGTQDVTISANKQYIVPGDNVLYRYDISGMLYTTMPYPLEGAKAATPRTVAVNSKGQIIAGFGCDGEKKISIYQADGTLLHSLDMWSPPYKLTCTPDDKLIVTFDDNTLVKMDPSGTNAKMIPSPPVVSSWVPAYVCCSKQGELFVGNQGEPKAVYRYVSTDGDFTYHDCVIEMEWPPWGIALSADEKELFVVVQAENAVKIFR